MKTDRFSDIIRRKLESIRPEFTEKDWARMQATLQQAGPPQHGPSATGQPFSGGGWTGQSWLLAAATVSTVMLIAFSIWQRNEINHLRQTVGQLKQQSATKQVVPAPSEQAPQEYPAVSKVDGVNQPAQAHESVSVPTQKEELAIRHDTVYITRYVTVPAQPRLNMSGDRSIQRTETPPEQRYATASRSTGVSSPLHQPNNLTKNPKSNPYGVSSTSSSIDKSTSAPSNPSITTNKPVNSSAQRPDGNQIAQDQNAQNTKTRDRDGLSNSPANAVDKTNPVNNQNSVVAENIPAQTEQTTQSSGVSANYELVASRPLSTASINWNVLLAQRAKRMRTIRPTTIVAAPQAPESQRVEQVAARFRAGVGGEFDSRMWSAGAFAELPIGKHIMVGVGLSQATYMGGVFITGNDFDARTHRNFRQEFGQPKQLPQTLDLNNDILNVDTRMVRVQIPLSLSYRVPVSRTLTFLPSIGTYMVLSNTEKVTFYYRPTPWGGFDEANLSRSHPVDLFSSMVFNPGLEWQKGRWVVQGSPVVTLPTETPNQNGPNWQINTSVGLRARLMYQF